MKKKKLRRVVRLIETTSGHWYEVTVGREVYMLPSSTNILNAYYNKYLDFWKENTSPEMIKQKREEGMIQGSKVHHAIYLMNQGEKIKQDGFRKKQVKKVPVSSDNELAEYLTKSLTTKEGNSLIAYENFCEEHKPITRAAEMIVYSLKNGYAGTLDWIGYLYNKKLGKYEPWLLDYKTSNQHSRTNDLQLSSYYYALCEMYKRRFRLNIGILYLGRSTKKKFSFKLVKDNRENMKLFLNTKKLWDDQNPKKGPDLEIMQEEFSVKTDYTMKGRMIKFNK
jgi:nitrite reductase/ring-hydroxylating ferredoxin subunit